MPVSKSLNVLASAFVIIGVLMTLENFDFISGISKLWPSLITLVGAGFLLLFFERQRSDRPLLWIGTFLTLVSFFFFYLNYTSWKAIARLWPLFLGMVGVSFYCLHLFSPGVSKLFFYLGISFIGLCVIFYLVFGVSTALWPTSLIIFGTSLLLINYYNAKCGK